MQKAKSRIKSKSPTQAKSKLVKSELFMATVLKKYLKHLPLLIISLPFYGLVYYLLTRVHPDKIRHFLIPNTYLPFQLPLFMANFFLFSYLLLNTRRGLELSLLIMLTLFLKLEAITNYLQLSLGLALFILIIDLVISSLKKRDVV